MREILAKWPSTGAIPLYWYEHQMTGSKGSTIMEDNYPYGTYWSYCKGLYKSLLQLNQAMGVFFMWMAVCKAAQPDSPVHVTHACLPLKLRDIPCFIWLHLISMFNFRECFFNEKHTHQLWKGHGKDHQLEAGLQPSISQLYMLWTNPKDTETSLWMPWHSKHVKKE